MTRRRRWWLGLALLLVLLAGGDALLWRWGTAAMQRGLETQMAQWRRQGWTVRAGRPEPAGWPLHARLVVPDLALSGPFGPPGGVAWTAHAVVLDLGLLHPRSLVVDFAGPQTLRLGPGPALPLEAGQARAVVPLVAGAPPQALDVALRDLRLGPPAAALRAAQATLHLAEHPGAASGEPAVSLVLSAQAIDLPALPDGRAWALGGRIATLELDGALTGPLPMLPDPEARATAWRDGGGTLALHALSLRWGPLDLAGSATLALDAALQPMGTARLQMTGQDAVLDALARDRLVAPTAAQAAKAVLALMAHTPAGGGPARVEVPLSLQDRTLAMGRIPLLRLPVLLWPQLVWSDAP